MVEKPDWKTVRKGNIILYRKSLWIVSRIRYNKEGDRDGLELLGCNHSNSSGGVHVDTDLRKGYENCGIETVKYVADNVKDFIGNLFRSTTEQYKKIFSAVEKAELGFTCTDCDKRDICKYAFDYYNTNGECLALK